MRALILLAVMGTVGGFASGMAAQERPAGADTASGSVPATLDAVEAALDSGSVEAARRALNRWFAEREASGGAETGGARARYLRARLTEDVDSAELDYLEVAITGDADYGAPAGLRLGQLRLARGEPGRAADALDRLRRDFPGHPLVADAWLWTGRARTARGERDAACEAFTRAAEMAVRRGYPAVESRARRALATCDRESARGAEADLPGYGVQIGAFGSRETAELLRARAEGEGYRARVTGPAGPERLYRVHVGEFGPRPDAERLAERLRADGFQTLIVTEEASPNP